MYTWLVIFLFVYILNYFRFRWKNRDQIKLAEQLNPGYVSLPIIGHSYLLFGDPQSISMKLHQVDKLQMQRSQDAIGVFRDLSKALDCIDNQTLLLKLCHYGVSGLMNTFQLIGKIALQNGGMTSIWNMSSLFVIISDSEMAETIMRECLEKHEIITNMAQTLTGNGSGFAPVKIWRYRRKLIAPTLNSKNMIKNVSVFVAKNEVMIKQLQKMAGKGNFPIWSYINAYSMDSMCESTMGVTVNAQIETRRLKVLNALCDLLLRGATQMGKPWMNNALTLKLTPIIPFFRTRLRAIEEFINEIIVAKRESVEKNKTNTDQLNKTEKRLKPFLELFIESTTLTNKELLEETKFLMMAGTDTTAVSISFTIAMLARHPDIQDKVYQELQEVLGDSARPVNAEDMGRLKYLEMVIKESLRLYPAVPIIARKVEQDIEIQPGMTIPKGCGVMIDIWAMQRNPKYWGSDAEIFRPERFINETPKHPVAFAAFSYGSRGCPGHQYAMYSLKCTLATLLKEFRILPPTEPRNGCQDVPAATHHRPLRLTFEIMMKDKEQFVIQLEHRNKEI